MGVDETDSSRHAAAYAAGMARRQRAALVFVYVRSIGALDVLDPSALVGLRESHDAIAVELRALRDEVRALGITADYVEVIGDAATELLRIADDRHADLLVVGRSTRRGHRVAGSVAVRLVHSGHLPVTVVP
ncbi:MAG: universal stress protein [Mycobacteriales bacterium]